MTDTFFNINTPNEFRAALRPYNLKNPPFPLEWTVHDIYPSDKNCELHITATVKDRDTGISTWVTFNFNVPLRSYLPISVWLHTCLMKVMTHEVDEMLHLHDHRINDPHRNEKL